MQQAISQFHFLMPQWFWLLIPAYGFLLWLQVKKIQSQKWHDIVDDTMRDYVVMQQGEIKQQHIIIHALAIFVAVFAISGPTWSKQPQPVYQEKTALIIALDLSRSMLAQDIKPSRLDRAKFIVDDVLNSGDATGQFALIAFANEAFVVTPFSTDKGTLLQQLRALSPQIMPFQGTNFADVIKKAETLQVNNELEHSRLLIITDTLKGINSQQIKSKKLDISILAISKKAGAPIPTGQGDFIKDSQNNIVISQLDKAAVKAIQQQGNIRFRQFTGSDNDLNYLLPSYNRAIKRQAKDNKKQSEIWLNQGHYFIWLLLPYFLMWFRKGLFYGLVFFVIPLPHADAFELPNWLLNDNQQAHKQFQNKQFEQASKRFTEPNWIASSLYKNQQYAEAENIWNNLDDAQSAYNAGNAAAQLKQYKKAIQHYKKALKKQPDFADAKANLKSIENFLKKQQKQNNKNQKNKQSDKQNQQQQNKQQSNKKQDASNKQKNNHQKQQGNNSQKQEQGSQPQRKQSDAQKKDKQSSLKDKKTNEQQQAIKKKQVEKSKGSTADAKKQQKQDKKEQQKNADKALQKHKQGQQKEKQQQQKLNVTEQRQLNKTEQWLQQIPDDPGGLLRRKFYYYSQQHDKRESQQPW